MQRLIYMSSRPRFSSKTQRAHFWFAIALLSPPLLLFQQMELCLSLLRSLFHGCGQLLSVARCMPLCASTENKRELVGHNSIQYFLVQRGQTVLCRTWALFHALFLLVKLLFCIYRKFSISVIKCTKTCFEQGLPVAPETRFLLKTRSTFL